MSCIMNATWSIFKKATLALNPVSWMCRAGLDKHEAEDLLDWFEANGYERRNLAYHDQGGFNIRALSTSR